MDKTASTHAVPSGAPEILAFGEAMALLIAETPGDLATVRHFQRHIAGADANVAIGLARLGFRVGWLSRVGDDSFGRYIRQTLQEEGLDCRMLVTDTEHPTGIMIKGRTDGTIDPAIEYYRRHSAASYLGPGDAGTVNWSTLRHLHVTGITPALSESCLTLTHYLQEQAARAGVTISFDPNLRPSLWPDEQAMRNTLNRIASQSDLILPGLEEGRILTGYSAPEDIARFYLDKGCRAVMVKLGDKGCYYMGTLAGSLQELTLPGIPVRNVVDTVGAGDGFAVGVISALLEGLSPGDALRRGNLFGALAIQVRGDMEGLPTRQQLEQQFPGT